MILIIGVVTGYSSFITLTLQWEQDTSEYCWTCAEKEELENMEHLMCHFLSMPMRSNDEIFLEARRGTIIEASQVDGNVYSALCDFYRKISTLYRICGIPKTSWPINMHDLRHIMGVVTVPLTTIGIILIGLLLNMFR